MKVHCTLMQRRFYQPCQTQIHAIEAAAKE
jgi:hypothetical protein